MERDDMKGALVVCTGVYLALLGDSNTVIPRGGGLSLIRRWKWRVWRKEGLIAFTAEFWIQCIIFDREIRLTARGTLYTELRHR